MRIKSELEIYLEGLKTPELKAIYNAFPKRQQRGSDLSTRIGLINSIRYSVGIDRELIVNLPSQTEIEKSKLELAAKKAAKPKKPSTPKIPDSICTWRAGHYGAKCTINKTPLRVNFSDSGRSDATVTDENGKAVIERETLMTAIGCQLVKNEWVEISTSEKKRETSSDWWGDNVEYSRFTIYHFQNQFGETAEFWDDRQLDRVCPKDPRTDFFHGHPDVIQAATWRNPEGQPIDPQWWCDTVIAYLKANKHLVG